MARYGNISRLENKALTVTGHSPLNEVINKSNFKGIELVNTPRLENKAFAVAGHSPLIGTIGESAYEIAVKNGFRGTELEWLNSLFPSIGENGNWIINGEDTGVSAGDDEANMIALTKEEILEICK